jgi:hypothetical protein
VLRLRSTISIRDTWVDIPDWFVDEQASQRRVHVYRTKAWREAVIALVSEDEDWVWPGEPVATAESDLIVTVVGSEPPVVASVELAGVSDGSRWEIRDTFLLTRYVAWEAVEDATGQGLLDAIVREMTADPPTALPVGDCWGEEVPSDLAALRLLRVGAFEGSPRHGYLPCRSCEREIELRALQLHDVGPVEWGQTTERSANKVAEQLELVCDGCHELLHPHDLLHQRKWLRPECPECSSGGAARRIIWGDVAEPLDPEDEEEFVLGGGALPPEPLPAFACAVCGTNY